MPQTPEVFPVNLTPNKWSFRDLKRHTKFSRGSLPSGVCAVRGWGRFLRSVEGHGGRRSGSTTGKEPLRHTLSPLSAWISVSGITSHFTLEFLLKCSLGAEKSKPFTWYVYGPPPQPVVPTLFSSNSMKLEALLTHRLEVNENEKRQSCSPSLFPQMFAPVFLPFLSTLLTFLSLSPPPVLLVCLIFGGQLFVWLCMHFLTWAFVRNCIFWGIIYMSFLFLWLFPFVLFSSSRERDFFFLREKKEDKRRN